MTMTMSMPAASDIIAPPLAYLPGNAMAITVPVAEALLAEIWMSPEDAARMLEFDMRTWRRWKASGKLPGPFKAALHAMVLCKRNNLPYGEFVPIFPNEKREDGFGQ